MRINVNSSNTFKFYPDIEGNLSLPEDKRFTIVVKKVNQSLTSGKWTKFSEGGNVEIDMRAKVKNQIVRLENPPLLRVDNKTEKELTIDVLLGDEFSELYPIVIQLIEFMNKMEREGGIETKKF